MNNRLLMLLLGFLFWCGCAKEPNPTTVTKKTTIRGAVIHRYKPGNMLGWVLVSVMGTRSNNDPWWPGTESAVLATDTTDSAGVFTMSFEGVQGYKEYWVVTGRHAGE